MCWSTILSFFVTMYVCLCVCLCSCTIEDQSCFSLHWDWFFACIHSDSNPCNKFAKNPFVAILAKNSSCNNICKEFFCSNPYKDLLVIFGRIFLVVVICISLDSSFLCKERGDITMWWLSNLIHCCERIWSCSCFLHDNSFLLSMLSCWCLLHL
jgi:hypothetical protein